MYIHPAKYKYFVERRMFGPCVRDLIMLKAYL